MNDDCLEMAGREIDSETIGQRINDLETAFASYHASIEKTYGKTSTKTHTTRSSARGKLRNGGVVNLSNKADESIRSNSNVRTNTKNNEPDSFRKSSSKSPSKHADAKLKRLQDELNEKVNSEARLSEEVNLLKIELNGHKKLLSEKEYYYDLKETISNLFSALLSNKSDVKMKEDDQILLKSLFEEVKATSVKLKSYDSSDTDREKLMLHSDIHKLKMKLKDEILHSQESYKISTEYIHMIKI